MRQLWFLIFFSVVAFPSDSLAQKSTQAKATAEEEGTYLGVLVSSVPEALYDHLDLPKGQGVLVTHVLPKSPAAKAGLQRHDILLKYDKKAITDCQHFGRLIQADKPEHQVELAFVRHAQSKTLEATLSLGPVLRIKGDDKKSNEKDTSDTVARGTVKTTGPASVSVTATPLADGNLKVTIDYYQKSTGRLRTESCSGKPDEIDAEVKKLDLPTRVQNLTQKALDRIRELELQKVAEPSNSPPPPKE